MRPMETESLTGDHSSDNLSKCLRELQLEFSGGGYVTSDSKTGTRNQVAKNTIYWTCDTALDIYTKRSI